MFRYETLGGHQRAGLSWCCQNRGGERRGNESAPRGSKHFEALPAGNSADGALVPFGTYWRLGANFATTFETNKEISFAGRSLAAGKYRVYAVPEDDHWVISLNSEFGSFGYTQPDYEKDIMSVNIASAQLMTAVEQFTIDFVEGDDSLSLRFRWDTTSVSLPIN